MSEELNLAELAAVNPDCREGKHRNCRGDAWNLSADLPGPCKCECHKGAGS